MENARFVVKTTMEKQDLRRFYRLTAFRARMCAVLAVLTLALSLFVCAAESRLYLQDVLLLWGILAAFAAASLLAQVEAKYRRRVRTDSAGTLGAESVLRFYEDRVVMESSALHSTAELPYGWFYSVRESRDYYMFYLSAGQASIIRKRDVADPAAFGCFLQGVFGKKLRHI